ncbi:MAG: hypothetical protein LAO09_18900 [Acidobacteriia bacterium]|nr:hypothetical protein [Terriglobia bacterium]
MLDDPKWELAILATVQGFYEKLLQDSVGGEVPVPAGLEAVSLQGDGDVLQTLSSMHRWLRLLDMAITPAMLRRALTPDTDAEIAEAMLRYFTRKKDHSDVNRDRTDLVATFLYRHPRVPGQWERRGYGLDGSLPLSPFEIALIEILADADVPALSEEQTQLLRQFDRLRDEAESFRDLNALLESGIILRVRELKQFFGESFYHPSVLATIAPYNTAFGRRFDELFMQAAGEIKSFAHALEEQGGSILGNVDGVDVTVEHVAALQESELLRIDYGIALEKFRRVSKLKKTLEQYPPIRLAPTRVRPPVPPRASGAAAPVSPMSRLVLDLPTMRAAVTPQQISTEESKLLRVEESIRVFVRVADPKFRHVVPMRFFNLILTPAEADAYCAQHMDEGDANAEAARALLRPVATTARMTTELEELKRAENSPSLWKLHADSLAVLLVIARTVNETAERALVRARQHGATARAEAIQSSVRKLQECSDLIEKTLSTPPPPKAARAGSAK